MTLHTDAQSLKMYSNKRLSAAGYPFPGLLSNASPPFSFFSFKPNYYLQKQPLLPGWPMNASKKKNPPTNCSSSSTFPSCVTCARGELTVVKSFMSKASGTFSLSSSCVTSLLPFLYRSTSSLYCKKERHQINQPLGCLQNLSRMSLHFCTSSFLPSLDPPPSSQKRKKKARRLLLSLTHAKIES